MATSICTKSYAYHENAFLSVPSVRSVEKEQYAPGYFLPGLEGMEKGNPEKYLVSYLSCG
jgi:hypothetical protein